MGTGGGEARYVRVVGAGAGAATDGNTSLLWVHPSMSPRSDMVGTMSGIFGAPGTSSIDAERQDVHELRDVNA